MNAWDADRLRLRAVEPTDAAVIHGWNQHADWGRNLDFVWPPSSLASVEAWTREQSLRRLENDRYHWLIETLAGDPVGLIDTHHCDRRVGTFSYGIAIAPEHRGNGYAAEAIRLVLRYYFDELGYQKVMVNVHEYNTASLRLHRRLGFVLEGTHRRMGFTDGHHFDVLWLGMTVEEFHLATKET